MPQNQRNRGAGRRRFRRPQGKTFWLRPPAFTLGEVQASNGINAAIVLEEADFVNPSALLNDTQKGAPVLERAIIHMGFSQINTADFWEPAAFNQVQLMIEYMVWTQEDDNLNEVTSGSTFDSVLENNRILAYGVMPYLNQTTAVSSALQQGGASVKLDLKSKVRLREKAVGAAIRANFAFGDVSSLANFNFFQGTFLVRTP